MNNKVIKIFLRLAISIGFLSAVADRFGWWPQQYSVWGNWNNFIAYTKLLNPWVPEAFVVQLAIVATAAEIIFPLFLIAGFKTELFARLSGCLLLVFAVSMTCSTGIKGAFDYSVFTAAAAAFALGNIKEKYMELDTVLSKNKSSVEI